MFLQLAHTNLEVYKITQQLTLEVYNVTKLLHETKCYNLISQMRRAASSVQRMNRCTLFTIDYPLHLGLR